MNASEFYQAGKLPEAIEAAINHVKSHPTDGNMRYLLAELLCFAGEWERADKQLDTLGQQSPDMAVHVSLFRHLLRAEISRHQFFDDGRVPEVLFEVSPAMQLHLEATVALRGNDMSRAAELLAEAEGQRKPLAGTHGDHAFEDFRDLDDVTSRFFEVLTSTGKYYWVPMERVRSLEFAAPRRPMDLVWRRTQIDVEEGPEGEVYLPVLYPGTARSTDSQLRLARGTDWSGEDQLVMRGCGQRMYLFGDEAVPILQLTQLTFQGHEAT